jgi:hypothetical protein
MKFFEGLCETLTRALGLLALSPWTHDMNSQQPVGPSQVQEPPHTLETLFPTSPVRATGEASQLFDEQDSGISLQYQKLPAGKAPKVTLPDGPIFAPPNASPGFVCDYRAMKGWRHSGGGGARNAWLEKPIGDEDATGGVYNIRTNYDQYAPIGTTRKVRIAHHLAAAAPVFFPGLKLTQSSTT